MKAIARKIEWSVVGRDGNNHVRFCEGFSTEEEANRVLISSRAENPELRYTLSCHEAFVPGKPARRPSGIERLRDHGYRIRLMAGYGVVGILTGVLPVIGCVVGIGMAGGGAYAGIMVALVLLLSGVVGMLFGFAGAVIRLKGKSGTTAMAPCLGIQTGAMVGWFLEALMEGGIPVARELRELLVLMLKELSLSTDIWIAVVVGLPALIGLGIGISKMMQTWNQPPDDT